MYPVMVCIDDPKAALQIVEQVRHGFAQAKVLVRAYDRGHAVDLIRRHDAVNATRQRARHFAERAVDALSIFPESKARAALTEAAQFAVSRGY